MRTRTPNNGEQDLPPPRKIGAWLRRLVGLQALKLGDITPEIAEPVANALDLHPDTELANRAKVAMCKLEAIRLSLECKAPLPIFVPVTNSQRAWAGTDVGLEMMRRYLDANSAALDALDVVAIELVSDYHTNAIHVFIERVEALQESISQSFPDFDLWEDLPTQ